ncbi:hypothetical protein EJB05_29844, partial [Eragrostis curvula]
MSSGGLQMLGGFSILRSRAFLTPPPRSLSRRPRPRAVSSSSLPPPPPHEMEASYKFGPYKITPGMSSTPRPSPTPRSTSAGFPFHFAAATATIKLILMRLVTCGLLQRKLVHALTLEQYHEASSLTFAIQDGPQAGQTVPHVHIHVIPRRTGDFEKNDEIYDAKLDLDIERKDRTMEEMAHEAN